MIKQTNFFDSFYQKMAKIMRILFALGFVLSLMGVQTIHSATTESATPDSALSPKDGSGNSQSLGFLDGFHKFNPDDSPKVNHLLTVNKSGEGIVTSTPAGIQCGETCSAHFKQGTVVTLKAMPKSGWKFYGWIGACIGETCQVEMDEAKTVLAVFVFDQAPLFVDKEGQGTVISDPEGIDCGETCSALFEIDSLVTLTATADPGWKFSTWSGDCSGTTCEVTMDQRRTVIATFVKDHGPFQFEDVPDGYWAEDEIYRLYASGITTGCSQDPLLYCPEQEANRAEMAVFLERGINTPGYQPPQGTGTLFADVPITYWAVNWIEQLYSDGITTGCAVDPLRYCPNLPVTRAEMAVLLLRSKYGSGHIPPAVDETSFDDVPITHWAADWIAELAAEGITTGVTPTAFDPEGFVTRAQMAVFLVRTFKLP